MKRKTLGLLGLVLAVSVASFGCNEKKETAEITTKATTTTSASESTSETTSESSEETSEATATTEKTTTSEESTTTEESSTSEETSETTKKETAKETTKESTTVTTTQESTTAAPTSEETTTETTTEATTTESTTEATTTETTTEATTTETTTEPTTSETTTETTTEETTSETTPRKRGEVQFSTTDRNGKKYTDAVFAKSKVTMINFFEPWCGPCIMEMPDLQKLYEVYDRSDFQIFGVYSDTGMEEDLDELLKDAGTKYPILHYAEGFIGLSSQYVPTTVFIDQNGDVITLSNGEYQVIGSQSYEEWKSIVDSLLGSDS